MKKLLLLFIVFLPYILFGQEVTSEPSTIHIDTTKKLSEEAQIWQNYLNARQQDKNNLLTVRTPGYYLQQSSKNILSGIAMQGGAIFLAIINSSIATNAVENGEEYDGTGLSIAGIALALGGLGFEIVGIVQIGKAGLCLDANGIGLKIKF
jgi:hypothetical protein